MKIGNWPLSEHEAREMRDTAIHEAAHLVILRRFGGIGRAEIWPLPFHELEYSSWRGVCKIFIPPGVIDYSYLPVKLRPKKSVKWETFVDLAGEAAVIMDREQDDKEAVGALAGLITSTEEDPTLMSDSDRKAVEKEFISVHTIQRMITMLREHWSEIMMEAEDLMNYYLEPEESETQVAA